VNTGLSISWRTLNMGNMNCNDYYRKKVQIFNYVGTEMVINLRIKGVIKG
jgi:hypothetical protein